MPATGGQLRTLERWRRLELASAQAEHAALATCAERQADVVAQIRQQIEQTQHSMRVELKQAHALSPTVLLRFMQFVAWLSGELTRGESALQAAQTKARAARDVVELRFQQLSTVQKLRARHAAEALLMRQRREQRWMDEQAAGRNAGD